MPKHKRKHEHDHHHKGKQHQGNVRLPVNKKGLHKDWRTWGVVIVMIVAILGYVLTMDESMRPFGGEREVPEAEIGE